MRIGSARNFTARFFFIACGTLVLLAALGVAQAQTRPVFPAPRPTPAGNVAQPQVSSPQNGGASAPASGIPQQSQPLPGTAGPAVPPVVTYRDGLLTVQAMNSSLSSVLSAIRSKAGIEFEGAENVSERVAISLGPAPEGEVLSAILAGSRYDFVAIGRADSPAIVQRVILTVKNKTGGAQEAQAQPRPANGQEGEEDETPDETVNAGDPQDTPVQPVPVPQQPQAQTPPQGQPKSPEQLLQELQEMRRQKNSPEDSSGPPAPRKQPPN